MLLDLHLIPVWKYNKYLNQKRKGWLCEVQGIIAGLAIVDLIGRNVCALFIRPEHEKRRIVKLLHDKMLEWYLVKPYKQSG